MVICNRLHFRSKTGPRVFTLWPRLTLPNNAISSNSAKVLYMKHFHHSVHPDNAEAKHLLFGISGVAWKSSQEVYRKQKCVRDQKCLVGSCLPAVMSREWARSWAAARVCHRLKTMCLHTHFRPSQRREQTQTHTLTLAGRSASARHSGVIAELSLHVCVRIIF